MRRAYFFFGIVVVLVWLGCAEDQQPLPPFAILPVSGDGQTRAVGTTLPGSFVVRVEDGLARPVPGVAVTFGITTGGGSLSNTQPQTTDALGLARTRLTLGLVPGANTVQASTGLGLAGEPLVFTATATAGAAATMTLTAGDGQTALVGTTLPQAYVVTIADAGANPVPGVDVSFTITAGAGSLSNPQPQTTDALGQASTVLTLGTVAGSVVVTASTGLGIAGEPAVFSATALAGAPAQLTLVSGDAQLGLIGQPLALPFVADVSDSFGNPLAGIDVTFAVSAGAGTLSNPQPQTTGATGRVQTTLALGPALGANAVTATTGLGLAGEPLTFAATGTNRAISITAGDGQRARPGTALPAPFVVTVSDELGAVVPGENVTFAILMGGGALSNPQPQVTDASGRASTSLTLGRTRGLQAVTASLPGALGSPRRFIAHVPVFDFNGDGFDDIAVGAPLDDDGGFNAGMAFVFLGGATLPASLAAAGADTRTAGESASDQYGADVAGAGDVNGDGFDDLIVGAPLSDRAASDAGAAYVFFGSATPPASLSAAGADVILLGGAAGDRFGDEVAGAGDINGDGFDDWLVSAPLADAGGANAGAAYAFWGSASPPATIAASAADVTFVGTSANDFFGSALAGTGDVNGDGFADLVVGAPDNDDGGLNAGAGFVFHGGVALPATITATAANTIIAGDDAGDRLGASVSGAGDVNGDGFADLLLGAPADALGGPAGSGAVFLLFGAASPPATLAASSAGFAVTGTSAGDQLGFSVAGAGDANGDGLADLVLGAPTRSASGIGGATYVVLGSGALSGVRPAAQAASMITGEFAGDQLGWSVAGLGDLDADGRADLAAGAQLADAAGADAGLAAVILGRASLVPLLAANAADLVLSGDSAGDRLGLAVGGR